ncbi:chromatin assembly factor 1 subunit B isoform X2 [Chelonus insularis]|uniref:chromatin assembly factor 1 subunit B isoform X2 n=1 Tax=Chelonus insularis TaxID=460826 RepID=UPI00158D4774|nr:chromatin assembly factor 1 subunit B isoform X2 [Chelonus insularis]
MKCTTLEIAWHNRDPVLSIDIEGGLKKDADGKSFWRLASGGSDTHVLVWHLSVKETGTARVDCVADLTRHQRTVNIVRFSPSGTILASGDDDGVIILWKSKEGSTLLPLLGDEKINQEKWELWKVLRKHYEDVYDISWSPDSNMLASGSADKTVIIWDAQTGKNTSILSNFKGIVQGVTWDPCNQHIATLSNDRICRLFDINTMKVIQKVHKAKIPTPPGHPLENKVLTLFHDDTFKSFFRRLTYTIDGSLIIAPSGIIEPQDSTETPSNSTIVFSRHNRKEPIMILPTLNEISTAVKCCPVYFELRSNGPESMISLPYRLVFAVATSKSVLIYDTQQISPIAVISNIHYTNLTDVAWSSDARILVVSSSDGYCSIIHFKEGELGEIYKGDKPTMAYTDNKVKPKKKTKTSEQTSKKDFLPDENEEAMDVDVNRFELSKMIEKSDVEKVEEKKDKSELVKIEKKPESEILDVEDTEDIKLVYDISTESSDESALQNTSQKTEEKKEPIPPKFVPPVAPRTPRRVPLITLSSPSRKKRL